MRDLRVLLSMIHNNTKVRTILDVGVGYGVLAYNVRSLLECHKFHKDKWKYIIDAIEINPEYITPIHKYVYDNIIIGDINKLYHTIKKYDMILLIEIIEHLKKDDAIKLVQSLKSKCYRMVISVPYGFLYQSTMNDNIHEKHVCQWTPEDFTKLGDFLISVDGNQIYAIYKGDMK